MLPAYYARLAIKNLCRSPRVKLPLLSSVVTEIEHGNAIERIVELRWTLLVKLIAREGAFNCFPSIWPGQAAILVDSNTLFAPHGLIWAPYGSEVN